MSGDVLRPSSAVKLLPPLAEIYDELVSVE